MRRHWLLCLFTPMPCQHLSSCASCSSESVIPTTVHHPHQSARFPSQRMVPILVHHPHHSASSPSPCIGPISSPITVHRSHHSTSSPPQGSIPIKVHGHIIRHYPLRRCIIPIIVQHPTTVHHCCFQNGRLQVPDQGRRRSSAC